MKEAKTTTETVSATIEENGKIIVDKTTILLTTDVLSPKQKVLHGSFSARLDRPFLPGFYRLALDDGHSYPIIVKGVQRQGNKALAHFLVVPEE